MEKIKNNKAITLIALIITIIILLILAGVAISFTIGEDGIFDKSKKGAEKYEMAEAKEQIELAIQGLVMEKTQNGEDFPTLREIVDKLYEDKIIISDDLTDEDNGGSEESTVIVTTTKKYLAEITLNGSWQYEIDVIGKLKERSR